MLGFPKPRPKIFEKRDTKRADEALQRLVYADVDARDGKRCRCCGRYGNPYAIDPLGKIHRCHIRDKSRGGEMSAANLCSLCWICAALETGKQLFFVGTNANHELHFEIYEVAVVEVFGSRELPSHVHIITEARR